jgi:hypothetical protein
MDQFDSFGLQMVIVVKDVLGVRPHFTFCLRYLCPSQHLLGTFPLYISEATIEVDLLIRFGLSKPVHDLETEMAQ